MSIIIKRNTGWLGMATKIQIRLNGKKAGRVKEKDYIDLELPDDKVNLKVTQFGSKSNEILVKDGDVIEITSTMFYRMYSFLIVFISILGIFIQNLMLSYKLSIFIFLYALILISIFFFNTFHLKVITDKIN